MTACRCTPTGNVDLDLEGIVDIGDLTLLINFLNCQVELTPEQLIQADVNGDCVVDQADVDYLIAYLFDYGPEPMPCLCHEKEVPDCE